MLEEVRLVKQALAGQRADLPEPNLDEELVDRFLTPKTGFSADWLKRFQGDQPLNPAKFISGLYSLPDFDDRTGIRFKRKGLEGHIENLEEYTVVQKEGQDGALSLTRAMGAKKDFVRGRSGRLPFIPGGLDINSTTESKVMHTDSEGLLDVAPGLSRGMALVETGIDLDVLALEAAEKESTGEEDDDEDEESEQLEETEIEVEDDDDDEQEDEEDDNDKPQTAIDFLLPKEFSFVRPKKTVEPQQKAKVWAHMMDINQPITNFSEMVPNPARTWPFELDNFQKEAVYHLEQGDSVFVAAHTSAGKTVVAEYAMSMALRNMTKCIYTSPIKALSNQKYRDFLQEYDDIGILTGDVQINAEASTLIMTTEILRSMLYRGADLIRDVEFIIFDEVHYVNDSERGVVWEEVIIMLPDHVKFILLSATVPNTFEFANWVGRTKQKDIYVISTDKRPVPLTHYLWAKNNVFEVVGPTGQFNEEGWRMCRDKISPPAPPPPQDGKGRGGSQARGGRGGARGGRGGLRGAAAGKFEIKRQEGKRGRFNNNAPGKTVFMDLFNKLKKDELLPAVVFVFSRKMTEQHAMSMRALDFNTGKEKSEVHMFIDQAVSRLRKEDRDLPQIMMLRDFLGNGIGVHHSGLLPIMKEVVEILFARGLVKVLFATETFAMGLNLPTRTVVFSALSKFDSKAMRMLSPGEYTQMAGRAGRRGLDKVGTVIILQNGDQVASQASLKSVILGTPTKLSSQFRLTFTMILSLLRIEAVRVEDVIQQSFSENAKHVLRPEVEIKIQALEKSVAEQKQVVSKLANLDQLYDFAKLNTKYQLLTRQLYEFAAIALNLTGHFCVFIYDDIRAVGILYRRSHAKGAYSVVFVSRNFRPGNDDTLKKRAVMSDKHFLPFIADGPHFRRIPSKTNNRVNFRQVESTQIEFISNVRLKNPDKILAKPKGIDEVTSAFLESVSSGEFFNEVSFDKIKAVHAKTMLSDRKEVMNEMSKFKFGSSFKLKQFRSVLKLVELEQQVAGLRTSMAIQNTELLPDYEQRLEVLKDGNYIDEHMNVLLKGRVACEISTGFELYVTELLLDNFLANYEPEEIVALLSAFVFEGARNLANQAVSVTPKLDQGMRKLLDIVEYVHDLATKHQVILTSDEEQFAEKGRFALMQAVYEWAKGMSFYEITQLTEVQEGTIVRVINRLDEVCRAVMSAARIMGDIDLYNKVNTAQERIKRDIAFCSSLYL
ncbi:Antiviral helicase SKI2 [Wickerhamiella sorbophila]|uniref:Antiviral helicase SKI2 n=1 Tax=Wickerhamiella sorbophila TaxID=45607 RepID=A0A2T0FG11_9ASCO|nr:Antiviral helicase SKI2 [Wickerhamiella sorbophila]PRT53928.1 Antiviral helicase SKI2 [Wickerhamiella sorbophila]